MKDGNDLENIIGGIIEKTALIYGNLPPEFPEPSIHFVSDICESIEEKDKKFVDESCLKNEVWIGGLLYISNENIPIIYIKKGDESDIGMANMIISFVHELTHFFDYIHYSRYMKVDDLRKLQENKPFLFWTEFHATYVSVLYAITYDILRSESDKILAELTQEMKRYCGKNKTLQLEATVNYSSRLFGKYLAWKAVYNDLPQYPIEIFINEKMGRLCKFFYTHPSFDGLKNNMDKLNDVVYDLETK